MTTFTSGRWAHLSVGIAVMLALVVPVGAQLPPAAPSVASRAPDLTVPTTKVLAIGKFTAKARPTTWRPYLDAEVRQTVELYLGGKIEQWWVRPDQTGVVFLFDADNAKDVQTMLDALPLGRAGLMEFELIPLGPLSPLRLLLKQPNP
jgi:hypothetical protein